MECTRGVGALFVLWGVAAGCDTNGYPDLGEPLDLTVPCENGSTVWVRSFCGRDAQDTEDGHLITEVVILGGTSFVEGEPVGGCFNVSQLHYDSSSRLRAGSFSGRDGTMGVTINFLYSFTLQPGVNIFNRTGTMRQQLEPPEVFSLDYAVDGPTLTLTDPTSGEAKVYRNLVDVVGSLDLTKQGDAYTFSNIASISMYHSFTRLLGYGSGGMTQYFNQRGYFQAATSGQMSVLVSGNLTMPLTTLDYQDFEEFGGFLLFGEFYTSVNPSGNGRSYGELGFSIRDDFGDPTSVITGKHDYTDVDVTDGYGGAGCYTLMPDGYPSVQIPSEIYNSIDLSRVLPTDGNEPGTVEPVCPNHVPRTLTVCPRG